MELDEVELGDVEILVSRISPRIDCEINRDPKVYITLLTY